MVARLKSANVNNLVSIVRTVGHRECVINFWNELIVQLADLLTHVTYNTGERSPLCVQRNCMLSLASCSRATFRFSCADVT